jgi:thioredoxin reductase (NADPH)
MLRTLDLFASLSEQELDRLASRAADIKLKPGEWLVREGERLHFFVVLNGVLQLKKDVMGREVHIAEFSAGDFFGEVHALFRIPSLTSLCAKSKSRVARFEAQQLQELIQGSTQCGDTILSAMKSRLEDGPRHAMELPMVRVRVVGTHNQTNCDEIRSFLRLNRIPYEWVDRNAEPNQATFTPEDPTVFVDQVRLEHPPTDRTVAGALGFGTRPTKGFYDVVIVGGGPAGLAAAVYGASEGLNVLLVERKAMGGQAGTSSRIENYLGFPNGISGDDLSERAVKQAKRFGAELILTRQVVGIQPLRSGGYRVGLDGDEYVESRAIILTTGVDWRIHRAEGNQRLIGEGVSYGAALPDPSTVIGKKLFIVGGGNSAGQAAMSFANYARTVTVLVRGSTLETSMSQYLIEQLGSKSNVKVETCTEVISVMGKRHLETIRTARAGEQPITRPANALYVMIGADAVTHWLPENLQRDEDSFVCTGRDVTDFSAWGENRSPFPLETNLPGFFCAGDVRHGSIKRVASAVGEGSMAISMVHQYLALQRERDFSVALSTQFPLRDHNKLTCTT